MLLTMSIGGYRPRKTSGTGCDARPAQLDCPRTRTPCPTKTRSGRIWPCEPGAHKSPKQPIPGPTESIKIANRTPKTVELGGTVMWAMFFRGF
jgi:hypothetical protein